jgi:hypothetical protein
MARCAAPVELVEEESDVLDNVCAQRISETWP